MAYSNSINSNPNYLSSAAASILRNSLGRITRQPNCPATRSKSRWLKVTIASACPLTAVSRTISSFGSDNAGLQRNANLTRLPTSARPSRTSATSSPLAPDAFKCSGRLRTASYSNISGTEITTQTAGRVRPARSDAKRPSRSEKLPPVRRCRGHKWPQLYDIARNITKSSRNFVPELQIMHQIGV